MNNNDVFKKLRVALQLRDDQIVEIMKLVDFRISASELGAFFRNVDHPKYMECGDQVLRNFLNGLVIYLRGTKENQKAPMEVLKDNKSKLQPKKIEQSKVEFKKKPTTNSKTKKPEKKIQVVENIKFKNGKKKS